MVYVYCFLDFGPDASGWDLFFSLLFSLVSCFLFFGIWDLGFGIWDLEFGIFFLFS
jgi:hypothetical protein